MTRVVKTFDCVDMKNTIQTALRRERTGMSEEDVRTMVQEELATGDDMLSRLWQSLCSPRRK